MLAYSDDVGASFWVGRLWDEGMWLGCTYNGWWSNGLIYIEVSCKKNLHMTFYICLNLFNNNKDLLLTRCSPDKGLINIKMSQQQKWKTPPSEQGTGLVWVDCNQQQQQQQQLEQVWRQLILFTAIQQSPLLPEPEMDSSV